MKRMISVFIGCLFACLLAFIGFVQNPAFGAEKKYDLKFQCQYPEVAYMVKHVIKPWFKTVEEQSGGRLKLHYFTQRAIVREEETFEAVKTGLLDIGTAAAARNPGKFPLNDLIMLPILFPDAEVASLVIWDLYERFPEWQNEFKGTKVMWQWASASVQVNSIQKPVRTLEDLKGMKMIGWMPPILNLIRALGANPIQVPPMDTYLALERGMADGVFTPYPILRPFKINEVTKYHTQADLMAMPFYAVMNPDKFNSLEPDLQKILEETTGAKMARACGVGLDNGTKEDVEWMKSKGNSFYVLPQKEKARWVEAAMPLRENWLKEMEGKGYKNVRKMLDTAIQLTEKYSKK